MMAELQYPAIPPSEKKRKRPRAARACELCRAKKYRCDELLPCSQCKRQHTECIYDLADHVRQRMFPANREDEVHTLSHETQRRSERLIEEVDNTDATHDSASNSQHVYAGLPPTSIAAEAGGQIVEQGDLHQAAEDGQEVEISDVNPHTQNPEFHGKTSSIAFLAALQTQGVDGVGYSSTPRYTAPQQSSLVSMFHNEAFSPESLTQAQPGHHVLESERFYFRQAQMFLDGYFQNIHFIHPILDRQEFMNRCEDLWFGKPDRQPKGFVALYYSVMSLGALIRTWDEERIDGLGRLGWSRKLFNLARVALEGLKSNTTIDSVQCLFFMAKVSQNELNPSLAYMYLGWATRSSFSAGFNRSRKSNGRGTDSQRDAVSRLWWGLYSLEVEISLALGRPDSLGADEYHNQVKPALNESETAIITVMVDFARIVKEVSIKVYLLDDSIQAKAARAIQIESKMQTWLQSLPTSIRPFTSETSRVRKISKDPVWAKRQRLVLEMRFYNVKMVLFRPFLTIAASKKDSISIEVQGAVEKCVAAAKSTIELMHEMYCHHAFFRTWWYNTTYVLYAASIVLCYAIKVLSRYLRQEYLELGDKAVEILEAMEESIVAQNALRMIKKILSSADAAASLEASQTTNSRSNNDNSSSAAFADGQAETCLYADDSFMSFLDLEETNGFLSMMFPLTNGQTPAWDGT